MQILRKTNLQLVFSFLWLLVWVGHEISRNGTLLLWFIIVLYRFRSPFTVVCFGSLQGLGKTVQAIASMSVYAEEWPLLVLTPSTARYHWESEFVRWLGINSHINKDAAAPTEQLIRESQIHVLTSSKDQILPNKDVQIVICSYGLAPTLAENGDLRPGQFKCAIVDESHMLKGKSTKRTTLLTPILSSTNRCILLSGTPALARPAELWPQLCILGTEQHGWWENEAEYLDRYAKNGTSRTRAELHALLTGTVMIRRLKNDILASMKPKVRQKTHLNVITPHQENDFKRLLYQLRQGKGELARLARHGDASSRYSENLSIANDDDSSTRSNILSRLYGLTGEVKIPVVAHMLNRWLDDATMGKLCIFAHHLSVLDSISKLASLSNDESSSRKFIRIDGSTMPKARQEQITKFQTDPTIRVALLGITAAGVAVTLTASSTVWFAELFWTPAVMIQAEDRCHRIGQQAQVECVYFVGRGTLDDILWRLLEKKFRQLGEFVEGKEKEKMVIHKTYRSAKEFETLFGSKDLMQDGDEAGIPKCGDDIGPTLIPLDASLEHAIEQLGEDEMQMLKSLNDDDEDVNKTVNENSVFSSGTGIQNAETTKETPGSSLDAPIPLSDDEDGDNEPSSSHCEAVGTSGPSSSLGRASELFQKPLRGCRIFRVAFPGTHLGFSTFMLNGRAVVLQTPPQPKDAVVNQGPVLAVGNVLVMINNFPVPIEKTGTQIHRMIQNALKQPPLYLAFADDAEIRAYVDALLLSKRSHSNQSSALPSYQTSSIGRSQNTGSKKETEVIELLD